MDGALEYQLYEYSEATGLLTMLGRTPETSAVMDGLEPGSAHSYIVQPISYVEIADNVSPEYRVTGVSGGQSAPPAEGTAAVYEPARAAEPIAQPAQAGAEPAQAGGANADGGGSPLVVAAAALGIVVCAVALLLIIRKRRRT